MKCYWILLLPSLVSLLACQSSTDQIAFNQAMAQNQLCRRAATQNDYQVAIEACKKAVEIAPKNTSFYWHLGLVYNAAGKDQEAIESYSKALTNESWSLDADFHKLFDDDVLFSRGKTYFKQGKFQNALEDFNKAIQLNPDVAEYHAWKEQVTAKLGQ